VNLRRLFLEHPASVNESYWRHFRHASGFGLRMLAGGVACAVHAWFPFLFVRTASQVVARLYVRMVVARTSPSRVSSMGDLSGL